MKRYIFAGTLVLGTLVFVPKYMAAEQNPFELPYTFNPLHFPTVTSTPVEDDNYEIHSSGLEGYIAQKYGLDNFAKMDMTGMKLSDIVTDKSRGDVVPILEPDYLRYELRYDQIADVAFILHDVITYDSKQYSVYINFEENELNPAIPPNAEIDFIFSINSDGGLNFDITTPFENSVTVDAQILDENGKKINSAMGFGVYGLKSGLESSEAVNFLTSDVSKVVTAIPNVRRVSTIDSGVYFLNDSDFDISSKYGQGVVNNFADTQVELFNSKGDNSKSILRSHYSFNVFAINDRLPTFYNLNDRYVLKDNAPKSELELLELLNPEFLDVVDEVYISGLDGYSYAEPELGAYRIKINFQINKTSYETTAVLNVVETTEDLLQIDVNADDVYEVTSGTYNYLYEFIKDKNISVETRLNDSVIESERLTVDDIVYDSNIDFSTTGSYKIVYKTNNSNGDETFGYFIIKIS